MEKKFHWHLDRPPIHYRDDTWDLKMIDHLLLQKLDYSFPQMPGVTIAWDVGAHIGIMTIVLSELYPNAVIHSYEPDPDNFQMLMKNVKHLADAGRVVAHNYGLSNVTANTTLYDSEDDKTNTGGRSEYNLAGTGSKVFMVQASKEVEGTGIPQVLKIDCEGAEFCIFESMDEALHKVEWITGEVHPKIGSAFASLEIISKTHDIKTTKEFGAAVFHFCAINKSRLKEAPNVQVKEASA